MHPQRSVSVSALGSTIILPDGQPLLMGDKPLRKKGHRASEPVLPESSLQSGTPMSSLAARLPGSWSSSDMWEVTSSKPSQGFPEESLVSVQPPCGDTLGPARHSGKGCGGLSRRIAAGMARVCC
ncbi:Hypothetical predicted protein [Marmota monax]|uniref:Uncharacterized protein n=1 Tax=Marmota monax TaxID=9995 RepID=A0A5E4CH70_MARMO|nr:hypothetical protein GHT09_014758 [Marmota monax]VTJ80241.1 Hypothetical predicted protein [Marmota monax]